MTGPESADAAGSEHWRPELRLTELHAATWRDVLVRSGKRFRRDNCLDLAAGLTYWTLLAIFPAAIVVVSLVRLVATEPGTVEAITEVVDELAPGLAATEVEARVREMVTQRTGAGVLLSFGVLGALWTASAYLRSFTRAANTIYRVAEGRPFYRLLPAQLGLTVLGLVLAAIIVVGLLVSGPVASAVGNALGVGETVVTIWDIAKLPVLVLLGGVTLSLLYWIAPNVQQPKFRWLTVGGAVALLVWILASAGFTVYVASFAAYDVTYGSLGAIIVFLVWIFLGNGAILLGVEINSELQRGRRWQAGHGLTADAPPLPPKNSRTA